MAGKKRKWRQGKPYKLPGVSRKIPGTKKWIGRAVKKPGSLSNQLGIPVKKNIPMRLLNEIIKAKAGQTVKNPTKSGKRSIKVTRLLERRAILAKNLKTISAGSKSR